MIVPNQVSNPRSTAVEASKLLKPTIYRTRGEQANYYITDVVYMYILKYFTVVVWKLCDLIIIIFVLFIS